MPTATQELASKWGFPTEWVFEIQVEQAIEWLESQQLHPDTRNVIYTIPEFWEWFLSEWEAIDELALLAVFKDDPEYLKVGGALIKHSMASRLSYYVQSHSRALQDVSIESIPRWIARRIGKQLENRFYSTLNPI